jgi:protein gp37
MAENSKIEWTDHTVNLWWGCAKVHTGCKNCYAEHLSDTRYKKNLWGEKQPRQMIKSAFSDLSKYQKQAAKTGEKARVFMGSMMDIFEDSKPLLNQDGKETNDLRQLLFDGITENQYPNLVFLFLTKRPENIIDMIPMDWVLNHPSNVWFGTSISDQFTTGAMWHLQNATVPDANRFLSIEPQIAQVQLPFTHGIGWIIQGGESGSKKRPFNFDWAYSMRDQCKEAGIPYFFKQIDKVQPIPEDLQIRELPIF